MRVQAQTKPWTTEHLNTVAPQAEDLLERMPKPAGLDHLQPAGDPWLATWERDPLREISEATLRAIPRWTEDPLIADLATEPLAEF